MIFLSLSKRKRFHLVRYWLMSRQIRNVICFALPITIGNVRIDFFQIDKEFTLRINLLLPPLSIKEMHRTLKINFISLSKSFEILSKYFWTKNFNLYRDLFPKERERKGGEETRDSINFHSFRNSSKKNRHDFSKRYFFKRSPEI